MKSMINHLSLALTFILCLSACTDFDEGGVYGGVAVDETAIAFESDGGNKTLSIHSGELWSLASIPDWLSIKGVSDSGTNDWIVRLEAEKNTGYDRSGTLSFSSKTRTASIDIFQKGVKGAYVAVESVELSPESLTLTEGKTAELTATVLPSTASVQTVSWASNNTAVASVSSTGVVTAMKRGTAQITVKTDDGAKAATCSVTVDASPDGEENGYEYVDLGLPSGIKWATCNVGASNPEEYGDYFAWGETEPKTEYSWSTYKHGSSMTSLTKYNVDSAYGTVDNKRTLEPSDDAARANWGGTWRMPTSAEQDELRENCTWTWTTQNGVNGNKVTSKKNGNSIFLPASGYRQSSHLQGDGVYNPFWSASLSLGNPYYSYSLYFDSSTVSRELHYRYCGQIIRPVTDKGVRKSVTSITLGQSSLTMEIGQTATLNATVLPTDATQPEVIWSSTNTSVATVGYTGKVTAVSSGSAQIKATTYDGGLEAVCTVTVKAYSGGEENGHEYVDLGLSVKWATCNVGASSPSDYGSYYAWGEILPKDDYSWSTYKWGSHSSLTKYNLTSSYGSVDNKTTLDPEDDVAHVNWGGTWRMPTWAELDELRNNCTWTWTIMGGRYGYKVTSEKNGNNIFLPAAGERDLSSLDYVGTYGFYWSSSIRTDNENYACSLYFRSSNVGWSDSGIRRSGRSVRPVTE